MRENGELLQANAIDLANPSTGPTTVACGHVSRDTKRIFWPASEIQVKNIPGLRQSRITEAFEATDTRLKI